MIGYRGLGLSELKRPRIYKKFHFKDCNANSIWLNSPWNNCYHGAIVARRISLQTVASGELVKYTQVKVQRDSRQLVMVDLMEGRGKE